MKANVGVIGAGFFGNLHAIVYNDYQRCNLKYVCDMDEKKAKALATEYNCSFTTDYMDVAKDKDIQIISITTPDYAHKDIAIQMLKARKNILIEKPLTMDVEEAEEIVNVAKTVNVKTMVDFTNRWNHPFVEAKNSIKNGRIGKPIHAYARLSVKIDSPTKMYAQWASKSGPDWYLMPHTIDLICWLLEKKPTQVYAKGVSSILRAKGFDCYDAVQIQSMFSDVPVAFESSWVLPMSWPGAIDFRIDIQGTEGHVSLCPNYQGITVADNGTYIMPTLTQLQNVHGENVGFLTGPIRHFVDCVIDDKVPLINLNDGLIVTKFLVATRESINKNEIVKIS
jgi:predicted dehydrogenase